MPFNRIAVVWLAACVAVAGAWSPSTDVSAQQTPAPLPPATAFLAGQVVDQPSGKGVAGATVSLNIMSGRGGGPQRPVVTDSQGRFYFANLAAGTYSFTTLKSGYSAIPSAVLMRTTVLAAGERIADLKINLVKLGAISGTLRDDAGDPVVGMTVIALRRTIVNGRPVMASPSRARSDDRGMYRISGLQPGDYAVCACARDPLPVDGVLLTTLASEPIQLMGVAARALKVGANAASLDDTLRTFAPTLYPNSSTVARADRVTVKPGEERANVDINLTAVRAVHITGNVIGSPSPVNASSFRLTPSGESDEGATLMTMSPALVQPDGRFDFVNVPSGSYVLRVNVVTSGQRGGGAPSGTVMSLLGRASGPTAPPTRTDVSDPWMFAVVPIIAGDRDVDGVSMVLKPGGSLSGKLQVIGNGSLPDAQLLTRGIVAATPLDPPPGQPSGAFNGGPPNPDGTFRVPFLQAGRYGVLASIPGLPTLKSVEVGGVDMTDLPIDVQSDVSDVVLTLSEAKLASINGTVARTGPTEDLTVLVFPADRRLWIDPAAAFRRYRAIAVARNGSFTASPFPAGEYFVAAVPDAQSIDWQQSARLEAMSKAATKVTLVDGEAKTVEVKR